MTASSTHMVQTEQVQPPYQLIAEQIVGITERLREMACDQDTIRTALQAFSQATNSATGAGIRPY